MRGHEEECADWDVVWDDRGHFKEPHTDRTIGLGTLGVRAYLKTNAEPILTPAGFAKANIITSGPDGRFGAILFIEKEGFMPLFEAVNLAERFDIAIMSSKGMSVTAARHLADEMCFKYKIPLLTLHDFDRSGFSIGKTVGSSNRRYKFRNKIKVTNFGLRLTDVRELDLDDEAAPISSKADRNKIQDTLHRNSATDDEIEFLMSERRVELNAMTSRQMVEFVEGKLRGIGKIIPAAEKLGDAYRLFAQNGIVKGAVEKAIAGLNGASCPFHSRVPPVAALEAPDDLEERVREYLDENPEEPWESAVEAITNGDRE